jgi:phosphatidate cytidylyltransferase
MTLSRILTAAVLIPAVVLVVWWGPSSVVTVLATAVVLLALLEFFSLGEHVGLHGYRIWTGLCAVAIYFTLWFASAQESHNLSGGLRIIRNSSFALFFTTEIILVTFVLGATAIILFGRKPVVDSFASIAVSAAAMLFLVLPFSAVIRIHSAPDGRKFLLFTLVLVWVGDTLAYFVGRSVGRLRMAPYLSPKKTWEGAVANLLGSVMVAVIAQRWMEMPLRHLILMAVLANIAGQMGDLLESAYKRSAGVKDSGTLLPGHGGMLDRIDALIFAAPVVWYYLTWLTQNV